jgi:hypothetical protein
MLLDGTEDLVLFDNDTTGHWWAITKPFSNRYKIIIDNYESSVFEDISYPVFSPDGEKWAFFAYTGSSIHLINHNGFSISDSSIDATDFGEIIYSPNGEHLAYTYFQGINEILQLPFRKLTITNRVGSLFIDNSGYKYALLGKRLGRFVVNIDGNESTTYDSIVPIGFWSNGDFIYESFNGNNWEVYKGKKQIGTAYSRIIDAKINYLGSILALLVRLNTGRGMSIVIADGYDIMYGKSYDNIWGLALHPTELLYGYGALDYNKYYVVQNSTEYFATDEIANPFYTYNGDELIFFGMGDFDPYINVNGKKTNIKITLYTNDVIAKKPTSNTIALTTNVSLLIYDYEKMEYYTGFMCDDMGKAIYNRRTEKYEALGTINNRLYLLTCVVR